MSLKHKVMGGVAWSASGLIIENSLRMLTRLFLARLLLPEVFGIIGFAILFIGLVQVFSDLGMSAALVQRKEEHLQPIDYDTAYWAGLAWGLFLGALLTFAIAPIAASFYHEPLLLRVIPALSVNLVLSNLRAVHIVNMEREIDFRKIVLPRNLAQVAAAIVGITMALNGWGVWSLVLQSVVTEVLLVFLYSYLSPWRPRLRFSLAALKKIFSFGAFTTGTNLFNYLTGNVDYLLIGKLLGANALGVYTLGYSVTYVVRGQIMSVVNAVFYPVYSKLQDDLETIKRYYFKIIRYNCIAIYPIMVGIILLAKPAVGFGLGPNWREAVVPMQFMAAAGLVHLLTSSNTVLMRGLGKPHLELMFALIKTCLINIPLIVLGVLQGGIVGAAAGLLAAKTVIFFLNNGILRRVAKVTVREIIFNAADLFLVSVMASSLVLFVRSYVVLTAVYVVYLIAHAWLSYGDVRQVLILARDRKMGVTGAPDLEGASTVDGDVPLL